MGKRVTNRNKSKGKKTRPGSVNRVLKNQEHTIADTAIDLVQVYEAVERSYRAAVMVGEPNARVKYSTNY